MKLSEAIRRGCKVKPVQCHGQYYGAGDAACALGAACSGAGFNIAFDLITVTLISQWPFLWPVQYIGTTALAFAVTIADMNDELHYTREEIADFVEMHGE